MRNNITHTKRLLAGLLAYTATTATVAAPQAAAQTPYPDTTQYVNAGSLQKFKVVDKDGVWFTTPIGLRCGIGADGSYGCSGPLPGAPPDKNEIGWFPEDPFPRLYHTDEPKFDSGIKQNVLRVRTVLVYRGSECAITDDIGVYCINGANPDSQILVNPSMTYRGSSAQPSA